MINSGCVKVMLWLYQIPCGYFLHGAMVNNGW